jgi:uncharacterized protein (TIGR02453 family)
MSGFGPETLALLSDLSADPRPEVFDANRQRYHDYWVGPARAFVDAVGPRLAALVPGVRAEPRVHGSILHPRQDIRFGKDRPLYRDHVGLIFWEGDRASAVSVLYLRVHHDRVAIGAGARLLDRDGLARYRRQVVDDGAGGELVRAVADVEAAGWTIHGDQLAVGPRDVRSDDPDRARLLRHTALWAEDDLPHPGVLGSRRFVDWCVRRWAQQLPIHRWLTDHLG